MDSVEGRTTEEAAALGETIAPEAAAAPLSGKRDTKNRWADVLTTLYQRTSEFVKRLRVHVSLDRTADYIKSVTIIIVFFVASCFLAWLVYRVVIRRSAWSVRVHPFSVPKALEENSGMSGAAVAEEFLEKLRIVNEPINRSVINRIERYGMVIADPDQNAILALKLPGWDTSLDQLADIIRTALRAPPLEVTGYVMTSTTEGVVKITTVRRGAVVVTLPLKKPCDRQCLSDLLQKAAEDFSYKHQPCALEAYYFTRDGEKCEIPAPQCAKPIQ